MVVNEKGLIAAMKEAYKDEGYTVAVRHDCDDIIIAAPEWLVTINKCEIPSKVLGMIAEHLREIPDIGTAYQVKKKEIQTEIFSDVTDRIREFHDDAQQQRILRRTTLTLGGFPLWQTATGEKIVKVYPGYEDIMEWGKNPVRLLGGSTMFAMDTVSTVYIRSTAPLGAPEAEKLKHLATVQWVAE